MIQSRYQNTIAISGDEGLTSLSLTSAFRICFVKFMTDGDIPLTR